jgi:hypothetical protein
MTPPRIDPDEQALIADMASLSRDPLKWVIYSFPWGTGELKNYQGPDTWQKELLISVRDGLLGIDEALRFAVASGNGPGKSALSAWLILWALSTFEDTKGIITSNTESQLKIKSWAELAKWYNLFIAKHWFKFTATAIYSADPSHEKTWRIDQVPWNEQRSEAFAGMHNKGKRILIIFDEASGIPDSIWNVTEGALTDEKTEIFWFVFGNPTRNNGKFHGCFHGNRHRWQTKQIDIRSSKLTNKKEIDQWIEDYGEDSDFVRIHVKGEFPNVSDRQFIPHSYVQQARGVELHPSKYNFAARILAVDPAWMGGDETCIGLRQGNKFRILARYNKNDDDFVMAGYVAKFEDDEKVDAVFVDFGYGTGIVSAGKQLGRSWKLIAFGGESGDAGYLNKRAEMWGMMKDWLRDGGTIPDDPILAAELVGPEYYVKTTGSGAGKIVLESKTDMKRRGLASPNRADTLALTFAAPVANRGGVRRRSGGRVVAASEQGSDFSF